MLADELAPGCVLVGKYRVERVLGHGGMGFVVAARHLVLGENVAIKVLSAWGSDNPEVIARFHREARIGARVRNEHVVNVIDVGELPSGAPFIVMEYLEGDDLSVRMRQLGPIAPLQAVDFLLQACVALAEAHSLGVTHRDLKPANLFCVRRSDGELVIKVLDFGVSRLEGVQGPEESKRFITQSGSVVGTPLYMSPEQVRSAKNADAQSDIWSLGVVLFEMLTGQPPFFGATFGEVVIKIATEAPASLRGLRPEVDPGLEAVVRCCLEKDRDMRYSNLADLAQALLPFAPEASRPRVERITRTLVRASLPPAEQEQHRARSSCDAEPLNVGSAHVDKKPLTAAPWTTAGIPSGGRPRHGLRNSAVLAALLASALFGLWHFSAGDEPKPKASPEPPEGGAALASSETERLFSERPARAASAVAMAPAASAALVAPTSQSAVEKADQNPAFSSATLNKLLPREPRRATPVLAPKDSCVTPYTIDSLGRKKFKHECFTLNSPR